MNYILFFLPHLSLWSFLTPGVNGMTIESRPAGRAQNGIQPPASTLRTFVIGISQVALLLKQPDTQRQRLGPSFPPSRLIFRYHYTVMIDESFKVHASTSHAASVLSSKDTLHPQLCSTLGFSGGRRGEVNIVERDKILMMRCVAVSGSPVTLNARPTMAFVKSTVAPVKYGRDACSGIVSLLSLSRHL